MSGEGASVSMMRGIIDQSDLAEGPDSGIAMPIANPLKAQGLRELADLLYLAACGTIDPKTARLAANELAALAGALEAGGACCDGYAVVPLWPDAQPGPRQ